MKKLFYVSLLALLVFEVMNVYFIMPFPGSQRMNSLNFAYFLYTWRWFFRFAIAVGCLTTIRSAFNVRRKIFPVIAILVASVVVYMANFEMQADYIFKQPEVLKFSGYEENKVPLDRLVIGVKHNSEIKAYPIAFLAYHHQVFDEIGGVPVIVTYCSVCRSGRVFEPRVKGKLEHFRLVGMDHFNAMFEDETTGSWWRQVNGKAVVGDLEGEHLPEIVSQQMSLAKWLELYPDSKVMQADPNFAVNYDKEGKFENGKSKGELTSSSSIKWNDKSWVIGVEVNGVSKAYSWIDLKEISLINDRINGVNIIVALSADNNSFVVLENPTNTKATILSDEIILGDENFDFSGRGINTKNSLKSVQSYQEFWHSWLTFHPKTKKY